jgi:ERCC4-type nuclease
MIPTDIESCLDSMSILIDTREQPSDKAQKRYTSFGCPYRRQKLEYGDYTYNFILPDGSELYTSDMVIKPKVVIERKMSLEELSNNLTKERARFAREFERASGASVYLLIESGSWRHIMTGKYKTRFNSNAFFAGLTAFQARYRLQIVFCPPELSGRMIKEILFRELKERLEKGEYG